MMCLLSSLGYVLSRRGSADDVGVDDGIECSDNGRSKIWSGCP
jgi:hypothetical protein